MGCGGSRMDPGKEGAASKFPPRIRQRFEEIKRQRNAAGMEGTLSKKKLLKEGDSSPSQDSADDKSLSSHEESIRAAKVAPEPESFKENDDNKAVEEETDGVEKEGENEEEGNIGHGYVCPGSPSFRIYCDEELELDQNDSNKDDFNTKDKLQRDYSVEIVASVNSNEVSEKAIEKRENEKKETRLRKKKSIKAVKNLLNVKSCYYPSCNGHHNARFVAQKTTA